MRSDVRWWSVGGLVVLGLALIALGRFLAGQGLEDADRWGSVMGVFLNVAAVLLAGYSAVVGRRALVAQTRSVPMDTTRNTLTDVEADGVVVMGRDIHGLGPAAVDAAAAGGATGSAADGGGGDTENRVEGGTFHGPLIMGRDIRDLPSFPPSGSGGIR
ncbi:hypothetical protein [Micromonospora wenchangensis]|uniref:hypothetical protein n=1 Tax=Micromonospora wenchangensis TaxID=1185415 RepID=UPI001181E8A8|nr:hypothetical protein [Micromonospora wenchangensis]